MKRTMAVILAGGEGERLSILSSVRAKPAVPFGGKYRIIDFTLSNCVNSDIDDVVVLTQYNPRSLNDHIGLGRPWDLDRNTGGVKMLQPYIARGRVAEWYRGTADAVLQNFNVLEHSSADTVLVLAGDHIYKMDYQPFVAAHRAPPGRRDDRGPARPARRREPDGHPRDGRVAPGHRVAGEAQAAQERPRLDGRLRLLEARAAALAVRGPHRLRDERHPGDARWRRPGLRLPVRRLLAGRRDDPVVLGGQHGAPRRRPRSSTCTTASGSSTPGPRSGRRPRSAPTSQVHRSLISHGCVINGTVVNSVLSPGVRVEVGAVVRDSIVMFDSVIRSGAVVDRSILDKEVVVGPGAIVGEGPDFTTPNRQEPARLFTGITVVGKRSVIPRNTRIGRNVKIGGDVRSTDFTSRVIKSGSTVERKATPAAAARGRGHGARAKAGSAAAPAPPPAMARPPAVARRAARARSNRRRAATGTPRADRRGPSRPGSGSAPRGAGHRSVPVSPLDCRACLRRTVPRPPRTQAASKTG